MSPEEVLAVVNAAANVKYGSLLLVVYGHHGMHTCGFHDVRNGRV